MLREPLWPKDQKGCPLALLDHSPGRQITHSPEFKLDKGISSKLVLDDRLQELPGVSL